ncbi:hypothetical protein LAD77_29965 [Klebsiella pneumoniae]|nr:hypothetical protein [Klebsiella pneumoniae]
MGSPSASRRQALDTYEVNGKQYVVNALPASKARSVRKMGDYIVAYGCSTDETPNIKTQTANEVGRFFLVFRHFFRWGSQQVAETKP